MALLHPSRSRDVCSRAFSILELMVAGAILLTLIIIVAEMVSNTMSLTNREQAQIETDHVARMVFDRMALDFDKIINRSDVDYIFSKQSGNDAMFFYSEAPAYISSTSNVGTVGLIGYRVVTSGTVNGVPVPGLQRLGKRLNIDGTVSGSTGGGMVFLCMLGSAVDPTSTIAGHWSSIGTESGAYTDGSDSDYHVLSLQVVRMEMAFFLKPYTNSDGTVYSGTLSKTFYDTRQGHTTASGTNYHGLSDVSAVVVGLAILDSSSQKTIGNTSVYTNVTKVLSDCDTFASTDLMDTSSSGLMEPVWNAEIESGDFAKDSGLSKGAASQVRVYQRFFYLK